MKRKLDENLGRHVVELLQRARHDVETVPGQRLSSADDRRVIEVCRRERRCLVTLDLDFGNPLIFKPSNYAGIAVLRLPSKPSHPDLSAAVQTLIGGLAKGEISGKLWMVENRRIREYQEQIEE